MAVLLFHIGLPHATGGFVGVDVFYVISGFLITGLLLREGEATGKVDLLRFYARRMRRLLPAALLVILATLAASVLIVSPLRLTEIAGDAAASALYVANFRFAFEAADYLALELPSPLLHYWSLGVEEQFYLLWPLILLLATRLLPSRLVGLFFVILAVASFGLSLYWTDASPSWAFFSPMTRAWELAAGALIAIGLLRLPARLSRITSPMAVLGGLALIVAAVILLDADTQFPGLAALLPVTGATLVIVGGLHGPTAPGRVLLSNPLSRYLGRISYSLYLWHWPLLVLDPHRHGERRPQLPHRPCRSRHRAGRHQHRARGATLPSRGRPRTALTRHGPAGARRIGRGGCRRTHHEWRHQPAGQPVPSGPGGGGAGRGTR